MSTFTPDPTGSGDAREPYIYYQDDWGTLWCGQMQDVLPLLGGQRFDACITDPPYGETSLAWDRWPAGWPALVAQHTRSLWSWGSMRMFLRHRDDLSQRYLRDDRGRFRAPALGDWKLAQDFVWEKNTGSGRAVDRFRRVHEIATHWYHGPWGDIHHTVPRVPSTADRIERIGRTVRNRNPRHLGDYSDGAYIDDGLRLARSVTKAQSMRGQAIHPTEKPVKVLTPLIEYSVPPGGTVIDVFAGSCSLGVAIRQLNAEVADPAQHRKVVLIEADEAMCAKAVEKRLSVTDLFTGSTS